jgi:hypothetical protein
MSALHSSRAPWFMLVLFCMAVAAFFLLAAGRDLGLIPEAVAPSQKEASVSAVGRIQQAIVREEQKVVQAEKEALHGLGKMLEHAGRRIEGLAGVRPEEEPACPDQDIPGTEMPGKLLSHGFSTADEGFNAEFFTDRPVPDPKVFFMSSPAVWVVDIPGTWSNVSRRVNTVDQGAIGRVVIGEHEEYLRVVFHYRDRERSRPDKKPDFRRTEDGFTFLVPAPEEN